MYQYAITYSTTNSYELPVKDALYQLLILPLSSTQQNLVSYKLDSNVAFRQWMSVNSFEAKCLFIKPLGAFQEIEIVLKAEVFMDELQAFDGMEAEGLSEQNQLINEDFQVTHYNFLQQTNQTLVSLSDFKGLPTWHFNSNPLLAILIEIREYLYEKLSFESGVTDAHTPAADAWQNKRGVCQDFTHIFIGICRAMGIPARYVSGYLSQGENFRGNNQLHAWVECLLPFHGWVGLDASNNLMVDHHYIKICHGRDYYDCSPIRGVLISGGKQVSLHSVSVDMLKQNQ